VPSERLASAHIRIRRARERELKKPFIHYSVVARNNDILKQLVLEAKRMYEKDAEHRVHIFMADPWVLYTFRSYGPK
jgi:hypothetical protein